MQEMKLNEILKNEKKTMKLKSLRNASKFQVIAERFGNLRTFYFASSYMQIRRIYR